MPILPACPPQPPARLPACPPALPPARLPAHLLACLPSYTHVQGCYILRADIPGVHKSEIRVSTEGVVVRFGHQPHPDRQAKDEAEQGVFHRTERVRCGEGAQLRCVGATRCLIGILYCWMSLAARLADGRCMQLLPRPRPAHARQLGHGRHHRQGVGARARAALQPPANLRPLPPSAMLPHPPTPPPFCPAARQYEDGVLELTIPKKQAEPPKVEGRAIAVE